MSENRIELSGIFSEGYGFVPKKLMRATDISSTTKLILCYLLSFTGAGITCFPQIKDMAEELNLTKRTIIRCINQAKTMGYISKHQTHRGGKIGTKNTYEILFMYDYGNNTKKKESDKKDTHKQLEGDIRDLEGDINDTQRVTPGNSNNNSILTTINNNTEGVSETPKVNHVFNLISVFSELYKGLYGAKYPAMKMDFGAIKNLIKNGQTPDEIEARMRAVFASKNLFFMKNSALDIKGFVSNYAKIPMNDSKPKPEINIDLSFVPMQKREG